MPSLFTRLREEGSQLDDCVNSASHPTQGHPEPVAAVRPSRAELPVPSATESLRGVPLNDESPPRSPRRRLRRVLENGLSADLKGHNHTGRRPSGSCTCRRRQLAVLPPCRSYDRGPTIDQVGGARSGLLGATSLILRTQSCRPGHQHRGLPPQRSVLVHPTIPVFIPQAYVSPRPRTSFGSPTNPSDQIGRGPTESQLSEYGVSASTSTKTYVS